MQVRSSIKGGPRDEDTSLVSNRALMEWDEELLEVVLKALNMITKATNVENWLDIGICNLQASFSIYVTKTD